MRLVKEDAAEAVMVLDLTLDAALKLVTRPQSFGNALGTLRVAYHLTIMLAMLATDTAAVPDKPRTEWAKKLAELKKAITNSDRLRESSDVSRSALLFYVSALQATVVSLPDPKAPSKVMCE